MTTDKAATLLADLMLNGGNVTKTARQHGVHKSTVTRTRQKAESGHNSLDSVVQPAKKREYAEIWGNAEELAAKRGVELLPVSSLGQVAIFSGIASDKRYREEHPESVRGVVIDRSQHVHVDTNAALEALIEAKKLLPGEKDA